MLVFLDSFSFDIRKLNKAVMFEVISIESVIDKGLLL